MERIVLGDAEIIRVVEWQGPFAPAQAIVPGLAATAWKENEDWLAPDHWEPSTDSYVAALQTWVIRHKGRTVLVDTGVGNGRERPHTPQFHQRQGDFPARLAAAGVRPEEVDVVVNTHLHADHVGWNTVDRDGTWVPAFPNAVYLMPAADHAALAADAADDAPSPTAGTEAERGPREDRRLMYADSILPVERAGQTVLWEDTHRIDDGLTLETAPGHSPGSSVLRLASHGERAVFVGDLLHSPVQILHPSSNSCFCEDPAQAAASRLRVLERAADERELVIPAHFGGSGAAEVRRTGSGFAVSRWAA
ncbi:MBL fold metallo-hydrolase [Streptomyces sp. CB01881]|uniref:MBL fold metallo-hydrolase n=1 Tax=Streptomyces sp. CB01881 TaxID=2078691 RepID=UPI000CDCB77C|nr:MBL fold metallo-hydrolase [Streptomyces sp. CB01881]AUY53384.1 MBL fold metallo-hydrolase [Streptomyces sp. CB01881]TYC69535.1 MBL fold metallo-hydrolase [Streptomyces sp. CB01881]